MKKSYLLLTIQLLLTASIIAGTYNTIPIDGNNTGWATDEQFTNCSAADNAYFTWDANNIYIGISDAEADFDNMATFVYFDSDPTGNNGTTDAYAWNDNITTPFKADYVVIFKNGLNNPNDYMQLMQYNNSTFTWDEAYTATGSLFILSPAGDTVMKFNVGADYRELKVNRSYIGNPDAIKTCMFTEQQWSPYWRYFTWPSNGWTDAGRTSGQSIPNYYGFFLESGISPNRTPYYDTNFDLWTGTAKSTSWSAAGNWAGGLPDANTLVKLPATATVVVGSSGALSDDLLMKTGAVLTVNTTGELTVNGGLYNYTGSTGVIIESSSSGNGSLIQHQYGSALMTVQCYTTANQWHSFAAPVSGLTSNDLYLNASPEVWLAEYNEASRNYTFISSYTEPLDNMKGWILWVGGTGSNTYNFEGTMRTGTQGSDNNGIRSAGGVNYGFSYVGNPSTSAIDWDATSGWTKTNLNNSIYIRNGTGWASYVGGVGNNGGSRYIAMNQGFFIQVADGGGSYPEYGTLKMTADACVHNSVAYLKTTPQVDSLIRLHLDQFGNSDETVIRFVAGATDGFDGQYDAGKMYSYSDNHPLIFSKSNDNTFSINSLPPSTQEVTVDVMGIQGISMTISKTEITSFGNVYLQDELTGDITNLATDDYTFVYDTSYTDRFRIFFTITDVNKTPANNLSFRVHSSNNKIILWINNHNNNYNLSIVNLLGQQIYNGYNDESVVTIPVNSSGLYIITVNDGISNQSSKIFVK